MGKKITLDPSALAWARSRFQSYYNLGPVEPPNRFSRREFAAFPFTTETLMRRHAAFATAEEFRKFLALEVPRHVYSSSAYYRTPDAPTMAQKEWLGADVVFDLDADHLRLAAGRDYPAQLALAKQRFKQLVDDFLLGDFGLDPAQLTLVFSGGRGYHAHIRDPDWLNLSSAERRELVDYVLGTGVDPLVAIEQRVEPPSGDRSRGRRTFHGLRAPDSGGWAGRISSALLLQLAQWESAGTEATATELERLGLSRPKARRLARLLIDEGKASQIRKTRSLDVFRGEAPREVLEIVLRATAVEVQGETDAPVTTDIHRLIRLPNSLHGGTGLRVVPLSRDALDDFDPLRDAPVEAVEDHSVVVDVVENFDFPFGGGRISGRAGERLGLSTAAALFLVLRGEATLPPSPES